VKRYNVSQAKEVPNRDKPIWIRVGVAFDKEDGRPPRIKLEALPIPDQNGDIWLSLFEDDRQKQAPQQPQKSPGFNDDILNDDIPF
jgi:hypothetical protein